ncbi:hypothetical protein [Paenibacillus glufosinatiresistens]|uniref:hypothetical protein n=1 Tax=Paenibacillus glufosinatiresistens TaxID=3070657 RepID=UPI00286EAD5D|nr:hypothetical protein [Paenibacillus sp. YX.27]
MDYIIKLAFVLLIFVYAWLFQTQNQEWDTERALLKDANNLAVHDASRALEPGELAEGRIIIDRAAALEIFKSGLEANLGLDRTLAPLPGSPLNAAVRIVEFKVLDESSGAEFPMLYEDDQYGITKYLLGPSVIAVIETCHPELIARLNSQEPIRVPAIQEYKPD